MSRFYRIRDGLLTAGVISSIIAAIALTGIFVTYGIISFVSPDAAIRLRKQIIDKVVVSDVLSGHEGLIQINGIEEKITGLTSFQKFIGSRPDGFYGPETKDYTEAFQMIANYSLNMQTEVDGRADEQTFRIATKIRNDPLLYNQYINKGRYYAPNVRNVFFEGKKYTFTIPNVALDSLAKDDMRYMEWDNIANSNDHDPIIMRLTKQITEGVKDKKEKTRKIVRFVQDRKIIDYKFDFNDYGNYPLETLMRGVGDCEDKVILGKAMLAVEGIDSKFAQICNKQVDKSGKRVCHAMLLIEGDFDGAYYLSKDNPPKKYFVTEMVSPGFSIGQTPKSYISKEGHFSHDKLDIDIF